jgi:Flp pilus assembly protein TadG
MYFGLIDATGLINVNRKVTAAAAIQADLIGQQKGTVLKTKIADQYIASEMIMNPIAMSGVRVDIYGYRNSASPVKVWHTSNNTGPSCGVDPATTGMASLMTAGNDLILVRTCTNYVPLIASWWSRDSNSKTTWVNVLGSSSFLVNQTITVRPRSGLKIDCYESVIGGALCT